MSGLTLAFMGTPDFAVPALEALVQAGHAVARVYTQPPRRAGRGHHEQPTPVHAAADRLGLEVAHPERFDEAVIDGVRALELDAAVVAAYGLILPPAVLAAPRLGCLNIHASLLPRWRGAAPIQRAILAGDAETGVSIMRMAEGLDTGPVLLAESVPIGPETTAGTLHDELAALGARLMPKALAGLADGTLTPRPQPEEGVTYARKIAKGEGLIDWREPAAAVDRRVRAFAPRPGAEFALGGERVKLRAARPLPDADTGGAAPGTLIDADGTVACGAGAVVLAEVQRPGRKPVSGAGFLRGERLSPGDRLG